MWTPGTAESFFTFFSFWFGFRTAVLEGLLANTYWQQHEDALLLTPFVALLTELPSPDEYLREIYLREVCLVLEWDCTLLEGSSNFVSLLCFLSLLTCLPPCPPPNPSICSCPSLLSNRAGSMGGSILITPCLVPLLSTWHSATLPIASDTWAQRKDSCDRTHQWISGIGKQKAE